MPDPLDPLLPGHREQTESKSFAELRDEFREENLQRVRARLRQHVIEVKDKDGKVLHTIRTPFKTDTPAGQEHRRMDEFLTSGGEIPDLEALAATAGQEREAEQEFQILPVPAVKLEDLADNMQDVLEGERVRYGSNPSGDVSREGPELESLDEQAILDYTAANVKRECGPAGLAPHLQPGGQDNASTPSSKPSVSQQRGSSSPEARGGGSSLPASHITTAQEGKSERSCGTPPGEPAFQNWWKDYKAKREWEAHLASRYPSGCIPPGSLASVPPAICHLGPGSSPSPSQHIRWYGIDPANSPDPLPPWHRAWNLLAAFVRSCVQHRWHRGCQGPPGRD